MPYLRCSDVLFDNKMLLKSPPTFRLDSTRIVFIFFNWVLIDDCKNSRIKMVSCNVLPLTEKIWFQLIYIRFVLFFAMGLLNLNKKLKMINSCNFFLMYWHNQMWILYQFRGINSSKIIIKYDAVVKKTFVLT